MRVNGIELNAPTKEQIQKFYALYPALTKYKKSIKLMVNAAVPSRMYYVRQEAGISQVRKITWGHVNELEKLILEDQKRKDNEVKKKNSKREKALAKQRENYNWIVRLLPESNIAVYYDKIGMPSDPKQPFILTPKSECWFLNTSPVAIPANCKQDTDLIALLSKKRILTHQDLSPEFINALKMSTRSSFLLIVEDLDERMLQLLFDIKFERLLNGIFRREPLQINGLQLIRKDESSVAANLYDMPITIQLGKQRVDFSNLPLWESRAKEVTRLYENIRRNEERLATTFLHGSNNKPKIRITWGADAKVKSFHIDMKPAVQVIPDPGHEKSQLNAAVTQVIAKEQERQKENDRQLKEKARQVKAKRKDLVEHSPCYGSTLAVYILQILLVRPSVIHTVNTLFAEIKEHLKSIKRADVEDMIRALYNDHIITDEYVHWAHHADYYRYYVFQKPIAELFAKPGCRNYGKNKKYEQYTDQDWVCLMMEEDTSLLEPPDWIKRLSILEHTIMLDGNMDIAKAYFSNAPEGVIEYIKMYSKQERSILKKSVYHRLLDKS